MNITGQIVKTDSERGRVYGWAYAFEKDGLPVVDHSGDVIDTMEAREAFEEAFVKYVLEHRTGDLDHQDYNVSRLIEAVWVDDAKLEAMGVVGKTRGAWVGYEIDRSTPEGARAWDLVKSGERLAFSIVGEGRQEQI